MGDEEPPEPPPPPDPPSLPTPPRSRTSPNRKQVVIAGVTIAALVIAATVTVVLVNRHSGTPANARPTPSSLATTRSGITTEDQLLTAIRTNGLTPGRAEQLFVLDVGSLPGVSAEGITPDKGFDGTIAVMDLDAEWGHLTKAQRDAATHLLAASRTQSSAAATARRTGAVLLDQLTSTPVFDYLALAEEANTQIAAATGTGAIAAFVIDISEAIAKPYAETSLYHLNAFNQWEQYPDGCHITVWDMNFQGLDAESAAAIMAHEVFHCFQQSRAGSGPNVVSLSPWITEGQTTWVMDELHPNATVVSSIWSKYAFTPTTKYVDRSYDAIGVYGHAGDVDGDQSLVWPLLLPMVSADIGGHNSAALSLLMGSTSNQFYSTWGGSYYEDQTQSDWHMAGPGTPPTTGPTPRSISIGNGDAQEIGLFGPYQAAQTTIDATADILVVILTSGYGKAHDNDYKVDKTLDTSAPLALCVKQGGCTCPDGSAGASAHTIPATSPISVGLDGGDQSLSAYASGESLDKYCKQPDPGPPPPSAPGGGGSGGSGGIDDQAPPKSGQSIGDPHLLTFDGRSYDLQAAGEFTLVKSTVDDFLVQARTVPVPGSIPVAVNQAVAAKLGGHRVTLTLENGVLVARVDGVADNAGGVTNIGTGTLERLGTEAGTGFLLEWPDGTTVTVNQMGLVGVNVTIVPAATRAGTLAGLLGNDNGQTSDDFVTAAGVNLGATPTAQALDGQFADSWRITQAQSLFDYNPGQTTATFTKPSFPSSVVDGSNVPGAAAATQECEADGVTDKYLLADCVLDATAVKDPAVVSHYAQAQVVMTVQSNLANHLPAFAPPSTSGGGPTSTPRTASPTPNLQGVLIDSGRVNSPDEDQVFTFTAQAGAILWVGPPSCDDGQLDFAVVDPQGKTLDPNDVGPLGIFGCQIGRVNLTTAGTYQLIANADKRRAGSYGVPIRFESPDVVSQTSYGQTISGSIPDQATHDIYQFSGQAGDIVHIFGSGCDIGPPNAIVGFEDASGNPVGSFALDCTATAQQTLPDPGMYELVVNYSNVGPFTFQFVLQK